MAWSWSHTSEAYRAAEANLRDLDHETLATIWAEWRATASRDSDASFEDSFRPERYGFALAGARKLDRETLADAIWERASAFATCDNGGFNAWMCPYGCGPHCVPFDREHAEATA